MKLSEDWKWLFPIVVVCFLVFANSFGGEFVYDDTRQILRNTLIQDNGLIWKALTSDVWAFKGDGSVTASNYWRPTFTAWHILNFRLFGINPTGWHAANAVLHALVCILSYLSLRRWGSSAAMAFAIAIIFAVHPVHVETVTWISGSPDLLFAAALLGSLWFARSYAESGSNKYLALTILLYALALGAKEVAVLCLPIYYFVMTGLPEADEGKKKKKKVAINMPLGVLGGVAVAWFFARLAVLGALSRPPEDAVGLTAAILSLPEMFAFYLRQMFFPLWLSINYPVEAVERITGTNFVIPLAVAVAALGGVFYLARSDHKARLGAAIFLLPLIPALNATVFTPEQIVHDRYLYLPLLGALMLVVPLVSKYVTERVLIIASVVIAAALAVQTFLYNRTWANEITVWSNARAFDGSAFTAGQLGSALYEAARYDESIAQYTDAIEKQPRARNYLGRGRAYLKKHQYDAAERDLRSLLGFPDQKVDLYALYQGYEALGIVYSETKNFSDAAKTLTEARQRLPLYSAALTEKLAIVLYQAGRKEEAFRELEAAEGQARRELLPESKNVFLRLGMLYGEAGRKDEARAALREYLALTASFNDKQTQQSRALAQRQLDSLK